MKKLLYTLASVVSLLCFSSCNNKTDVVGTWKCQLIDSGRNVSFILEPDEKFRMFDGSVQIGIGTYSVSEGGNVTLFHRAGGQDHLTRNGDGSLFIQNDHMVGNFSRP